MNESQLLAVAFSIIAVMFGLLTALLGWLGAKMYAKLDELTATVNRIAVDLHGRINGLETRITVVETYYQRFLRKGTPHAGLAQETTQE